jgi:hypothetical protein
VSVVYEVNLSVDAALEGEYREWLRDHVGEMLALPGFVSARCFDVLAPPAGNAVELCVQYLLRDQAALDSYLQQDAARMRADAETRFGTRAQARRRVLRPHSDAP